MKYLLSAALLLAPFIVNADEEECKVMDIASLTYVENIQVVADADVGAIYQAKAEHLMAFAKEHKVEGFRIISQDATVSSSCCGNMGLQLNVNFQITYSPSYQAFTALQKHSGSGMVSTYRTGMESCKASN
ncbi:MULTISPECIES: hypothetical protein [Alkalimonas]|uniref:Uncharacterized protein n=1 Tax=Alkalimonas mucilaginosa TaxID=3057676 RepID=A0ABU7JCY6_9GAMM|nr:hypothetical protein [Alkalimonas sp. MEB004]MEE2023549.1 hypothetical protein [Alkalimonas sp. MEB004]